jgi:hypothetical protein
VADYQRPWWLFVNKPGGLITTVRVETPPQEQRFIIRGEPLIQGLAWLTWGPLAALLVITLLTGLAIALDVREQSALVRGLFIILFLGGPVLAWVAATILTNQLAKKYIEKERQAEIQESVIRLLPGQGELFYQTRPSAPEERLAYEYIRQVKVDSAIGGRDGKASCLLLETDDGPIILLNEALGNQNQKLDLAREIQQSLNLYSSNQQQK